MRKIKVIQRPKIDANKLAEMHDNDKRILTKADGKKILKGDKKKKGAVEDEAVNLLSREQWLSIYLWIFWRFITHSIDSLRYKQYA